MSLLGFNPTPTKMDSEPSTMPDDAKQRLLEEARDLADRFNKLNTFMAGDVFPTLPREDKDLLYEQQRAMSSLLQILGKRLERAGTQFSHE